MVDVLGHLGMALLWLAPAWYFIDRPKTATLFVAASFWFGMLPDVDLVLSNVFPSIHHHGVFHTILVVTLLAAFIGPVVGWGLHQYAADSGWWEPHETSIDMGVIGVWVAAMSHLFADMLSAPDIASPIEPLWPLYNGQIVLIDVLWYTSWWATVGLFTLGLVVNLGLAYWKFSRADDSRDEESGGETGADEQSATTSARP